MKTITVASAAKPAATSVAAVNQKAEIPDELGKSAITSKKAGDIPLEREKMTTETIAAEAASQEAGTDPDQPRYAVSEILAGIEKAGDAWTEAAAAGNTETAERAKQEYYQLHKELGKETGAGSYITGIGEPLNVYEYARKDGVKRNPEFEKKGLCTHSVGIGLSCGHQCTYCSSPVLMRTQKAFSLMDLTSYVRGMAVFDPASAERIKELIPKKLTAADVIQFSTVDDGWSPEARKYNLGRRVMQVLLENTPAQIRVLTKSAEVEKDFDLFEQYKDRIIVGLSTGLPPERADAAAIVEPNASPLKDRYAVLKKAHDMGLRTYGMLCPCLPLMADTPDALSSMFDQVMACGVEKIWSEAVNPRGQALINTAAALYRAGLKAEGDAVNSIRTKKVWSEYVLNLVTRIIETARNKGVLDKLRILQYPSGLTPEHMAAMKRMGSSIIWLEKTTDRSE